MPINKEELAWAAGFFDGEGCFFSNAKNNNPSCQISQVHGEVLERFRDAVGIGVVRGPIDMRRYSPRFKPQWKFDSGGFENTQHIFCLLWKNLGAVKREQGKNVLRKYLDNWRRPEWMVCRSRGHRLYHYSRADCKSYFVCANCHIAKGQEKNKNPHYNNSNSRKSHNATFEGEFA